MPGFVIDNKFPYQHHVRHEDFIQKACLICIQTTKSQQALYKNLLSKAGTAHGSIDFTSIFCLLRYLLAEMVSSHFFALVLGHNLA